MKSNSTKTNSLVSNSLQSQFFNLKITGLTKEYLKIDPKKWEEIGSKMVLKLFHQAAERVPAYKDFLKKNHINPKNIKTLEDFKELPIVGKKNYLTKYTLKDLCWDGNLANQYIISSSSGSTGEPFLWPRGEEQEREAALQHELIFKEFFQIDKQSTLFINCFSMGTWIAGPLTLAAGEYLSRKGYPILTVTPSLDKQVTFSLIKKLAGLFDQIIISGYPPYIKDILDSGKEFNVNWKNYKIKFLFAAEGFSEIWRSYIHETVGSDDSLCTSINIYGSADAAVLASETPVTTTIRRFVAGKPKLINKLFGENRLPTLCQFDPRLKFFEEVDGELIFTTRSGIPLIRYSIGDNGRVVSFEEMNKVLLEMGCNLQRLFNKQSIKSLFWKLPFVYVFGRSDLTVSLYGLLIYPEHIKFGLEHKSLKKLVTGKFVMSIEYDENQNQHLILRVELAKKVHATERLISRIEKRVVAELEQINSEYNRLVQAIGTRSVPVIEAYENGNIEYFNPGTKQKWVKKS